MTLWHYLGPMLLGSVVVWVGAIRGALRGQWGRSVLGFVPVAAIVTWFFGIWVRLDWDSGFWEQSPWWLGAQFVLLGIVWIAALGAWRSDKTR